MHKALRGAAVVLLTVLAVVWMSKASAKFPILRRSGQHPPEQEIVYAANVSLSQSQSRQEEIQVELALLADPATFPYFLEAHVVGGILELRGFIPSETVRQRTLELACHKTALPVCNKMLIQDNLIASSLRRPAAVLQEEAAELLEKNMDEAAQTMSVGVQSNGLIVVTGLIDSLERKLAVSQLFRRLSGCHGVVNELTATPTPPNSPSLVQTTLKDSSPQPFSLRNAQPPVQNGQPVETKPALPLASPPTASALLQPVPPAPIPLPSVNSRAALPSLPKPAAPEKPGSVALAASRSIAIPGKPAATPLGAPVILPIKIFVDQAEPTLQSVWEKRLRQRVEEASTILQESCGVRLTILEVGTWESDTKRANLTELLQDFRHKVPAGMARLVIGFTGLPSRNQEEAFGCSLGPLQTHILIREYQPRTEPEKLEMLVHELGHFLGACHSPDKNSVMRAKLGDGRVNLRAFAIRFDPINALVMTVIAEELAHRPVRALEELSPRTRQRLVNLFITLARTMPNDPSPVEAIRRLGGLPPRPLTTRQVSRK